MAEGLGLAAVLAFVPSEQVELKTSYVHPDPELYVLTVDIKLVYWVPPKSIATPSRAFFNEFKLFVMFALTTDLDAWFVVYVALN